MTSPQPFFPNFVCFIPSLSDSFCHYWGREISALMVISPLKLFRPTFWSKKQKDLDAVLNIHPGWIWFLFSDLPGPKKMSSVESFPFIYEWFEFSWCSSKRCCHLSLIPSNPSEKKYVLHCFHCPKILVCCFPPWVKHHQFPQIQHTRRLTSTDPEDWRWS